jgi:mannose-6-phosphate isomerase-like protein (cupin superfamily)
MTLLRSAGSQPAPVRVPHPRFLRMGLGFVASTCSVPRVSFLLFLLALTITTPAQEQQRKVTPTWLARNVSTIAPRPIDISTQSCQYTPIFGEADADSKVPVSVVRFGELTVAPNGNCNPAEYPRQEELYFILSGNGLLHYAEESHPLAQNDFTYIAPAVRHSISNPSNQPLHLVLATVRIPAEMQLAPSAKLQVANLSELQEQTVEGHPNSVLYKLLIGPHTATRDRINATYNVADFFLMDFAPGGTNFPHHHEVAEEIYLLLDGQGRMAAGGGMDGIEGLHDAKPGDAYYFRQNCTVGFYNQETPATKAHILAIRTYVPLPKNAD